MKIIATAIKEKYNPGFKTLKGLMSNTATKAYKMLRQRSGCLAIK